MIKKMCVWAKALSPMLLSACLFVACEKSGNVVDPENPEKPDSGTEVKLEDLDNQAAFNNTVFDVRSVVYTTEEVADLTVLYLSPTEGITDIDGMESADDFIRLAVVNTKGSNTNFTNTENSVSYGAMVVDASNCSLYKISYLDVVLYGTTAVEIKINIRANDGTTALLTNYYGACTRWPSSEVDDQAVAVCTEIAQILYFGQGTGTNAHQYDLLVATSPLTQTTDGLLVLEEKEGYAMHIAFFAIPNNTYRTRLQRGTYKFSEQAETGTYLSVSYVAKFSTENGRQAVTTTPFDGDITVSTDNNDVTTIRAYFIDESSRRQMIVFRGKLGSFLDATSTTYLPALNEDVDFKASKINAIYYGRMGDEAIGTFELVIYEDDYLENKEETYAATVMLTNPYLFTSKKSLEEGMSKLNGTYYGASTFTQTWSWFAPVELNAYGMVQPFGTFVHKIDGTYYGAFGYADGGEVYVSDAGDGHIKVEFDLISNNGSKMKGSYEGPIEWDWQIVASDGDDGTSTLEADYEFNLDRITEARLVVPQQIYIEGVGYTNMNEYQNKWGSKSTGTKNDDIGYQYIAFGNLGINNNPDGSVNEGDIVYIELVTAPGEERQLKPGHYFVSPHRWPAYFHPMKYGVEVEDEAGNKTKEDQGVAIKGMLLANTAYTSHWQHHKNQNGLSVMDGHAYFYGGQLWIKKNDDGTYTFDFDCTCVRDHHVRGSWTGPVTGIATEESTMMDSWRTPMLLPGQSADNSDGWRNTPLTGEQARELQQQASQMESPAGMRFQKLR